MPTVSISASEMNAAEACGAELKLWHTTVLNDHKWAAIHFSNLLH